MRTTIDIDDDAMALAMRATGLRTKREVVHRGLELLAGLGAQQDLRRLLGTSPEMPEAPRRRPPP
ncbi:MAG: type II toxin-antitoxin system VapB family antitoxin [Deltaproteobacteria bacterium]|nr:type II toxin-antitoxin system VapB family antitoxin [Deltaproteobacteria bacterium]